MATEAEKKQDWGFYDKSNTRNNRASVGGSSPSALMDYYRRSRNLQQSKSIFLDHIPTKEEGRNGDIVFWKNKKNYNKIEQFIKNEGTWINLTEGRPSNDSLKTKKWVQGKTG